MRIGIWNTAFLGDTVLTLPLIHSLYELFPSAQIDFWVREAFVSLYKEQSYSIYGYNKKIDGSIKGLYALSKKISSMKYDVWINPHPSYRSSLLMFFSTIQKKISYTTPLINTFISTHRIKRKMKNMHEIERLRSLLKPLKTPLPPFNISNTFYTPQKESLNKIEKYWKEHDLNEKKVMSLAIGSAWPTKQWPKEHFAELIQYALKNNIYVCILGSGEKEEKTLNEILEIANTSKKNKQIHPFFTSPLEDIAVIIKKSSLCCGNDTGLMHLSWLQHVPTIMLFGPTSTSLGFYPMGEHSHSLGIELKCRPCGLHGAITCPQKHFLCMKNLSPKYVWKYVEDILL